MQQDVEQIQIAIRKIKVISFAINELAVKPGYSELVKVEVGQRLGFGLDLNLVELTLRFYYHYPDDPAILTDISVQNIFEIPNLKKFVADKGLVILPGHLISTIVGLAISHTRALLTQNLSGTLLQETIISIVNPAEVAKHFFPYMFESENQPQELVAQESQP